MAKKKNNKSDKEEKDLKKSKPRVNPALEGFDIKIDSFGEITSTYNIDKINEFLNKKVDDKKLRDREDIEEIKGGDKKGRDEDEESLFDEEE